MKFVFLFLELAAGHSYEEEENDEKYLSNYRQLSLLDSAKIMIIVVFSRKMASLTKSKIIFGLLVLFF